MTKVSDLDGAELRYQIAVIEKKLERRPLHCGSYDQDGCCLGCSMRRVPGEKCIVEGTVQRGYNPERNGNQLVALIEKHKVEIALSDDNRWAAKCCKHDDQKQWLCLSDTLAQAVLRAIVTNRFGESVGE